MMDQAEHNLLARDVVAMIVNTVIENRGVNLGASQDILVALESIMVGIILSVVKVGDDAKALDLLMEAVRERVARARLRDIKGVSRA